MYILYIVWVCVCVRGEPSPNIEYFSGIFDLLEKTWTFWMKNPRTTEPLLTLPLLFKWNSPN